MSISASWTVVLYEIQACLDEFAEAYASSESGAVSNVPPGDLRTDPTTE
jgi:hypothetical protein